MDFFRIIHYNQRTKGWRYMSKTTKSAMEEAYLIKLEKIDIPKQYLIAFYQAQMFESMLSYLLGYLTSSVKIMVLKESKGVITYSPSIPDPDKITLNKIYERLQVFLKDQKYKNLMKLIKLAMENRNKFIHSAFKTNDKIYSINDACFI